jgi:methionyl-tRNA formyltransferase
MKIVFFGTPDYVLPVVTALHKKYVSGPGISPVVSVVTQSPKPSGRKQFLSYSPIDKWAHDRKIPVLYSSKDLLGGKHGADLGVLAAHGEIITKEVIKLFPHGILVIHPSLLPEYRGTSPIPASIASGNKVTGVSIIKMDEKIDHGPVISQFKEEILAEDTTESLRERLFEKSAEVLIELLDPYLKGKITPRVQDETLASYTTKLTKEDGFIPSETLTQVLQGFNPGKIEPSGFANWHAKYYKGSTLADFAERFIRAMQPWPGAWTILKLTSGPEVLTKRIKILKAHTEGNKLVIDEVLPEGKNPVSWQQLNEAYSLNS